LQAECFDKLVGSPLGRWIEKGRGEGSFLAKFARTYHVFSASGGASILSRELYADTAAGREMALDLSAADELSAAPPLERVSALCMRGYLQNQLLRDIDAVSMAHSLEVRVPYLDVPLIDLALSLPQSAKLSELAVMTHPEAASYRATGAKKILVDIGRELLPLGMDTQPKRGFAMPFAYWMKNALRETVDDCRDVATIRRRGLFDAKAIVALKQAFDDNQVGWAQPWLVMMTELWCQTVLDRRP